MVRSLEFAASVTKMEQLILHSPGDICVGDRYSTDAVKRK